MTLLRLKSAILTRQCLSTNRLGDLRSLCRMGGLCECSCSMPCIHQVYMLVVELLSHVCWTVGMKLALTCRLWSSKAEMGGAAVM